MSRTASAQRSRGTRFGHDDEKGHTMRVTWCGVGQPAKEETDAVKAEVEAVLIPISPVRLLGFFFVKRMALIVWRFQCCTPDSHETARFNCARQLDL